MSWSSIAHKPRAKSTTSPGGGLVKGRAPTPGSVRVSRSIRITTVTAALSATNPQ